MRREAFFHFYQLIDIRTRELIARLYEAQDQLRAMTDNWSG